MALSCPCFSNVDFRRTNLCMSENRGVDKAKPMQRIGFSVSSISRMRSKPKLPLKYGYRPPEAADLLGSKQLLAECVAAGWIKPVIQRKKMTLFAGVHLTVCWARILDGEMPPRIVRAQ